jgi:hypothetical protein
MRPTGQILLAGLALLSLNGCVAGAAGLALTGASLLTSMITDGGERKPHIDFDPNRELSETLAEIDHGTDPLCKARLNALRQTSGPIEPPPGGQCANQPVCLGGMRNPMLVIVCADDVEPSAPAAAQDTAASRWTWNRAQGPSGDPSGARAGTVDQ